LPVKPQWNAYIFNNPLWKNGLFLSLAAPHILCGDFQLVPLKSTAERIWTPPGEYILNPPFSAKDLLKNNASAENGVKIFPLKDNVLFLSAVFLIPHFKPLLFSTSLKDLWWKNGFKITGE